MERFPWDDLLKILQGGQRMAKVQNGEVILEKTDDRRICDSKDPNIT